MEPDYHVPRHTRGDGWLLLRMMVSVVSWVGSAAFVHYHGTYFLKQHARGSTFLRVASYRPELYAVAPIMIGLLVLVVAMVMDIRARRLWRKPPWRLYLGALLLIGGPLSWLLMHEFGKLLRS